VEESTGEKESTRVQRSEVLKPFAVRLRQDQINYIKAKKDPAEWLRDLIDLAMAGETRDINPDTPSGEIIALAHEIRQLDAKIKELDQDPIRIKAKRDVEEIPLDLEDLRRAAEGAKKWSLNSSGYKIDLEEAKDWGYSRLKSSGLQSARLSDKGSPPPWLNDDLAKKRVVTIEEILAGAEAKILELSGAEQRARVVLEAFDVEISRLRSKKSELEGKIAEIKATK